MKTLADLKRRLQPGVELKMTFDKYSGLDGRPPRLLGQTRKILTASPSLLTIELPDRPDASSRLEFPKASQLRIDGPNAFTILGDDGMPHLSYWIGGPEQNISSDRQGKRKSQEIVR